MPDYEFYNGQRSGLEIDQGVEMALKVRNTAGYIRSDGNGGLLPATIVNPNLLDNAYFGNPVNQRGQTEYTGAGYTIDRWLKEKLASVNTYGTLLVETDCIRLIGGGTGSDTYLRQKIADIDSLRGKTVTLSFLIDEIDGTWAIGQYADSSNTKIYTTGIVERTFVVSDHEYGAIMLWNTGAPNGQIKIRAAKLELGTEQTLAHLENGNWVLNEIPNYAEELAKCQRTEYPLKSHSGNDYGVLALGFVQSTTQARFLVELPVPMRAAPAVTLFGNLQITTAGGSAKVTAVSTQSFNGNSVVLICTLEEKAGLTANAFAHLQAANDTTAYVNINSDL